MLAMAAARAAPSVRADGSLKFPPSAVVPSGAGAGDGVAGMFDEEVFNAGAGAGAAGVEGVCTEVAGVEGGFDDDEAEELAGTVLG